MDRRKKLAYDRIEKSRQAVRAMASGPKPETAFSWSMPYRLKGIAFGLGLSALYSYFILHGWYLTLIIPATIFGYFIGWVVGHMLYNRRGR